MRIVMFYHSLVSDWNHGNAHFLRGIVTELRHRGHEVEVFEPEDSWSRRNLVGEHGHKPLARFQAAYPGLHSTTYSLEDLDLDAVLQDAQLVLVHEWNAPELVRRIGEHRRAADGYRLLFHDTHHRMVTAPEQMRAYDLTHYDGVLAYGRVLQELYQKSGKSARAWIWHEAADTRVFRPWHDPDLSPRYDLVWIGNWGDGERTAEISEFLIQPARELSLHAKVYGVRYPEEAKRALSEAGIHYGGWLANFEVPRVFAQAKVTVHIPRRPYVQALPGIPTIRVFEALACGIPLICSPWHDAEHLFRPGRDYLLARNGREMKDQLKNLIADAGLSEELRRAGLETIRRRHTCAHRVDELLAVHAELQGARTAIPV